MILQFKSIQLYNFGSYSNAIVDLSDRGFCLVSGKNNYIKDNALSNGSGKSMIWSAICYALTGETINGLHSNLKNINIDEKLCFVELVLGVNGIEYKITRYIEPKSDLKLFKNSVDISGKTLTDSKKILDKELPELTKDLIASTILLGQGLPNKLSSFSPSGRKDLLEKLTKSDYMIQDIKERLENRQLVLAKQLKDSNDSLLVNNNTLNIVQAELNKLSAEYSTLKKPDFNIIISELSELVTKYEIEHATILKEIGELEALLEKLSSEQLVAIENKTAEYNNLIEAYNNAVSEQNNEKTKIQSDIKVLEHEINTLKSVTDICPVCHQKLPNISIPDTADKEKALADLQKKLAGISAELAKKQAKKEAFSKELESKYSAMLTTIQTSITENKQALLKLKASLTDIVTKLSDTKQKLTEASYNKTNWDKYYSNLKAEISKKELTVKELTDTIHIIELANSDISEHIAVHKKISTLVSRDFRGFLLEDIIRYIDYKAKEYCNIVFGTKDLSIALDKNDLNITYCGKLFDSLSGGEKQRCDIILQFAIRDLLQEYLGYSSNIIVLDEVFDNLDAVATEKIINLISTNLKDIESVFVISHHAAELGLSYDTEIQIVKNELGISEIYKN